MPEKCADMRAVWRAVRLHIVFILVFETILDMMMTPTDWRFILYGQFLFNAIPVVLSFILLFVLTRKRRLSLVVSCGFLLALYISNSYLHYHLDQHFLPAHFWLALTNPDIAPILMAAIDLPTPVLALAGVLSISAVTVTVKRNRRPGSSPRGMEIAARIRLILLLLVAALPTGLFLAHESVGAALRTVQIKPYAWDIGRQTEYGLFTHIYLASTQPVLFNHMRQGDPTLVLDYAASSVPPRSAAPARLPNIMLVMAESLFDPKTLKIELRKDPMAGLRVGDGPNRMTGLAHVHTVGGFSWKSEYALTVGIPVQLFGVTSPKPFDAVDADTWSIAHALKEQGYRTAVLYAIRGDWIFPARQTYLSLGYDSFLDIGDIRRQYGAADGTPDGMILNAAERMLEESEAPLFLFLVTTNLHMPYAPVGNDLFVDSSVGTPRMQEFFRRLNDFSVLMGAFLKRLEKQTDPLLFAMLGDHIPPLPRVFEEIGFRAGIEDTLYRTPYLLYSNYGLLDIELPDLDISYVPGLIFELAGLDGGRYFRVNQAVRKLCHGRFARCDAPPELLQSYYAYLGANTVYRRHPQ